MEFNNDDGYGIIKDKVTNRIFEFHKNDVNPTDQIIKVGKHVNYVKFKSGSSNYAINIDILSINK
jgi:hypothetical protein